MGDAKTIAFEFYEPLGLMLLAHSGDVPNDSEWETYLALAREVTRRGVFERGLVTTDGGAPNARQRKAMGEAYGGVSGSEKPTAVLSASAVIRGVITAFSWLFRSTKLRMFAPERVDDALAYLGVSPDRFGEVKLRLAVVRSSLTATGRP